VEWAALITGGLVGLSSLAFAWWSTQDSRQLGQKLVAAQRLAVEQKTKLIEEQRLRWNETVALQAGVDAKDREIAALRRHLDGLEKLIAAAGGDELALARLRQELSTPEASEDDPS